MELTKWDEFVTGFLPRKASGLAGDLFVSVFAYLVPNFGAFITNIFRLDDKFNCSSVHSEQLIEADSVVESKESTGSDFAESFMDSSSEEDSPKLVFKFQSFEDFIRLNGGKDQSFVVDEPLLKTSFCRVLQKSEGVNSEVKKMSERSNVEILEIGDGFGDGLLSHDDFLHPKCEMESVQVDRIESGLKGMCVDDGLEKLPMVEDDDTWGQKLDEIDAKFESDEVDVEEENEFSLKSESIISETVLESDGVDFEDELGLKSESIISDAEETKLGLKSESESMISDDGLVDLSYTDESISDGFLSDGDIMPNSELHSDNEFSVESLENDKDSLHDDHEADAIKELRTLLKSQSKVWASMEKEMDSLEVEYIGIEQELDSEKGENMLGAEFLTEDDFIGHREKPDSENKNNWEEDEDLETLWEHQDILEQLSIEIKNAGATGLPTIDEDAELSKFSENLKPWKIEEKFPAGQTFNLVHKFYRSYWERMRKLDILSYQKMYAIGLLQSKEPIKSVSGLKSETSSSTLFHSLWRNKNSKIDAQPTMKLVRELQNDLELVYVGQMCHSWEILHWQYDKALELWEADPHCLRRFNLVYGEFQQFQILLQRFVEDECYQGPRVQTYVNCRRSLHNLLLQVPVIREDKRDKKRASSGDDPMTSDMLVEAMEESIRTFWQFVRADKHQSASRKTIHCELQGPADGELLSELTKTLHKKEKKVKDILRTGNCILKKLKRHNGDDSADQVLCFFSQVDIKLVARVLRMPRLTTDQLQWCADKLSSINFVNGRIQVEPSFSLFPC